MANIDKLQAAGIIASDAQLSQEHQDVVNSLTPEEVSALISVKGKLTPSFQDHLSSDQAQIGIVF